MPVTAPPTSKIVANPKSKFDTERFYQSVKNALTNFAKKLHHSYALAQLMLLQLKSVKGSSFPAFSTESNLFEEIKREILALFRPGEGVSALTLNVNTVSSMATKFDDFC